MIIYFNRKKQPKKLKMAPCLKSQEAKLIGKDICLHPLQSSLCIPDEECADAF